MKAVLNRVAGDLPVEIEDVDISADPALEERYGTEVPVLLVNGKRAAKYRITAEELTRILFARSGGSGGSGGSGRPRPA